MKAAQLFTCTSFFGLGVNIFFFKSFNCCFICDVLSLSFRKSFLISLTFLYFVFIHLATSCSQFNLLLTKLATSAGKTTELSGLSTLTLEPCFGLLSLSILHFKCLNLASFVWMTSIRIDLSLNAYEMCW